MEPLPQTRIVVQPDFSPDQLFDFYCRNGICDVASGKAMASRILSHPHVIVGALSGDELVALARATFDGLGAAIMEISLDLRWQGPTQYENGSLVEQDPHGLGAAVARRLLDELEHLGADFIAAYVVQGTEETFYHSIGLKKNAGHLVYIRHRRP